MKYQLSDLIDLLSIIIRKQYHLKDKSFDEQYKEIIDSITEEKQYLTGELAAAILKVGIFNSDIWNLEAAIRNEDKSLTYEEIGRRAIKIREYNKERIKAKNEITKLVGGYLEKKVKHASQD